MRIVDAARALAVACAFVALAAGAARAQHAEVEQWSVDWTPGFADDFEDGVFTTGPGELYNIGCGSAQETAGKLVVTSTCGFELQPNIRIPSGVTMRARLDVTKPLPVPIGGSYGIMVKDVAGTDAVYLLIRRGPDPNGIGGSDTLFLELADEGFHSVASQVLADNPASNPQLPEIIELELTLTPDPVTGTLIPSARFSECGSGVQPCAPLPALVDLPASSSPPADGGALAAGVLHIPAFKETVPQNPFHVAIEDWSLTMEADDDFASGALGALAPYQTSTASCGSASVANGALDLDLDGSCPKVVAAFVGSAASPVDARATYRFAVPEPCAQVGVGADAGGDFANVALVRDWDGSLGVWLTTEPEDGAGPAVPILERTTLSDTPIGDPTLAGVAAIELRLALAADVSGDLVPHGQFRLCDTSPCPVATPFEDLDPATFPPDPLPISECGALLTERGLPSDGGVLAGATPIAGNLFASPEPGALAACTTALLALALLARRRD